MTAPNTLQGSADEQATLRAATLWAAEYVEKALPIFEQQHDDARPREAIEAAIAFGQGAKRNQELRQKGFAALKAGKDIDEMSKCVARASTLVAAVAYTHTNLQTGDQGIRQARHILGPIVYTARALELSTNSRNTGDDLVRQAAENAPDQVKRVLRHMPEQPVKNGRLNELFASLDALLR